MSHAVGASVCLLLAISAAPAEAVTARNPALRLSSAAPVTFTGVRFARGERVRVTLRVSKRKLVRRATANARGTFTVRFGLFVAIDPCRGRIVATAVGNRGSRATYSRACRPPDPGP